ncbi:hypothetical protein V2J09_000588 [Rumex salicifolius]
MQTGCGCSLDENSDCVAKIIKENSVRVLKVSSGVVWHMVVRTTNPVVSQFMQDPRKSHLLAAYRVLHDLKGVLGKWEGSMVSKCDNKSTINIAHNPVQHDKTMHVKIDRHFIKEKINRGDVTMIASIKVPHAEFQARNG